MKLILTAVCAIILGFFCTLNPAVEARSSKLLGARECTWGPSYWCSNITNAKNCHAVRHCIQTVWEKQTVPEDNDSICQICLDMVKQARDQLQSNETQEDLKAVFEGSCKLIPLKEVRKECVKLADNFIPELIEALASQMNPQIVCSVAGLCNNADIDRQLAELAAMSLTTKPTTTSTNRPPTTKRLPITRRLITTTTEKLEMKSPSTQTPPTTTTQGQLSCSGCNNVATLISNKFQSANRDDVLENMLRFCGQFSSFSDACANIVLTYYNDIYDELKESLNSDSICHMSGVCSTKYHQHPEMVEIRPMSNVGVIPVKEDIPCELCEQLVKHLRDLLVTNTTKEEFKHVLEGLCNQAKGFKQECLSIVDQYCDEIYDTLVNNLDANGACFMIGVCPKGLKDEIENRPIMPLLPSLPPATIEVTIKQKPKKKLLGENEPKLTNEQIQSAQLPIDKLLGAQNPDVLVENGQLCTLCEYFLHFVQEALSTPRNEDKIKEIISTTCDKMPSSIRGECHNFVETYGDAVIALLIQNIDPSQICPMLKLCPEHVNDMEVFAPEPIDVSIVAKSTNSGDKPTCPLCLFAVQQVQEMIKSDKSTENIKHALDNLCVHLPKNLQGECVDFVNTYSHELIVMLVTDFTPQQICVYINLCGDNKPDLSELNINVESGEDTMTNEIPDDTVNGHPIHIADKEYVSTPECLLCERIVKEVEKRVVNKKSREQIKHALEHACDKIPKIKDECHDYVEKYGDRIIDLFMAGMAPKQVCRSLELCMLREADDLDIDEALTIDVIAIPSNHPVFKMDKMTGLDDIISAQVQPVGDSPQCVMCEFAMVKLEQELQDKKTQDEIKHAVENICSKMPKTIAANCKKFVDQYANLILNLIDTVPPKEICQRLQLCPNVLDKITDEVVECGVCHGTVFGLHPFIKMNAGQNLEHRDLIEQGCDSLPAKYYEKCTELINYYGESIVNLINFGTDKAEICAEIGKCFKEERSSWAYLKLNNDKDELKRSRRSTNQKLLGSEKCTWGPSYWCDDMTKAEECKATQYCTEKVWGKSQKSN